MAKNRKNKKRKAVTSESEANAKPPRNNPLLEKQRVFLESIPLHERHSFFDEEAVSPDRRAELWMQQADLGESTVNQYAWATPNEKAMRVIKHFQPIIEIGCGANAYWCQQMKAAGIDTVGYDIQPEHGGHISQKETSLKQQQAQFKAKAGGPDVLARKENANRTLFLCYPDENDATYDDENSESMGLSCLRHYTGDIVIHVGELFTDSNLSIDQAPWGRSSSPEFQQMLAADFHCLLKIALPNWLHTSDTLSVWKRSKKCTIVFGAEEEDDDDEDEEVEYRHVPLQERLPTDVVAPCLAHLLTVSQNSSDNCEQVSKTAVENSKATAADNVPANTTADDEYACPW